MHLRTLDPNDPNDRAFLKREAANARLARREWVRAQLVLWPEHLRGIGRVLYDVERQLSDGYDYYLGYDENEERVELVKIAERLYQAVHE